MHSITIIGVDPPCPRCKLLGKVIDEKVSEMNINVNIQHWVYTDTEAQEFAQSIGLMSGTAKNVAIALNEVIDNNRLNVIINNKTLALNTEFGEYNDCNWSPDLDEFLKPFQLRAKEAGILMTPVLIINGEVKHQGSVPALSKINEWLSDLK
jgi:hypothetical protein